MRTRLEIYCDILHLGLLNIRNNCDDAERCFAESDHLHNIPGLLQSFGNEDLHRYYWETMRPSFIGQSQPEWLAQFEELWTELESAQAEQRESP